MRIRFVRDLANGAMIYRGAAIALFAFTEGRQIHVSAVEKVLVLPAGTASRFLTELASRGVQRGGSVALRLLSSGLPLKPKKINVF
jgi:hypothetical protein